MRLTTNRKWVASNKCGLASCGLTARSRVLFASVEPIVHRLIADVKSAAAVSRSSPGHQPAGPCKGCERIPLVVHPSFGSSCRRTAGISFPSQCRMNNHGAVTTTVAHLIRFLSQ
jgi:hypothetical protein